MEFTGRFSWERVSRSPGCIGTSDPPASCAVYHHIWFYSETERRRPGPHACYVCALASELHLHVIVLVQYFFLNEACAVAQWVKAWAAQAWPADLDPQNQHKDGRREPTPHFSDLQVHTVTRAHTEAGGSHPQTDIYLLIAVSSAFSKPPTIKGQSLWDKVT